MRLIVIPILMLAALTADPPPPAIYAVVGTGKAGYSGDGGPAMKAELHDPFDVALDGHGKLSIADVRDQRVRALDLKSGVITTFCGTGEKKEAGDGGPYQKASLFGPRAVAVGPDGSVYICEREGNAIRRVNLATGI